MDDSYSTNEIRTVTALREGLIKLHTDTSIEDLAKKLNGKATLK